MKKQYYVNKCDFGVNYGYMNHLRSHPYKSDSEDKMTKKCLKDLKVTTYTTKEHLPLW